MTTTASARETFATRSSDLAATVATVKLTAPQDRDLRLIAAGRKEGIKRAMFKKLADLGLLITPPITVEQVANPGTWPGSHLSELGMAYVRRAA